MNNSLYFFLLFIFLLLASCLPEPNGPVPADETYIYSGTFRAIQDPYIEVLGERYENSFGLSPIQIAAEVRTDILTFTIYGKDYDIFDVNFFINHADCIDFNGSELLIFKEDEAGNEEIEVIFNEDFWKRCYLDDDIEKEVSFIIKSENRIF